MYLKFSNSEKVKVFSQDMNCENLSSQLKAVDPVSKTRTAEQERHHELCVQPESIRIFHAFLGDIFGDFDS